MLDSELDEELDDGRFLVLKDRDDLPAICIQRVPEPKRGKVRIHLDLGAKDLDGATERIVELGGSWDGADRGAGWVVGRRGPRARRLLWRTFADPEGHEFDVIETRT